MRSGDQKTGCVVAGAARREKLKQRRADLWRQEMFQEREKLRFREIYIRAM